MESREAFETALEILRHTSNTEPEELDSVAATIALDGMQIQLLLDIRDLLYNTAVAEAEQRQKHSQLLRLILRHIGGDEPE